MKSTEEEGLDNIFKQRLKEPDSVAEYRESDWDAFEQMLDEDKKRPVIFWMRIATGIAAALLLAFGWLYMQSGNAVKPVKQNMAVVKDTANNVAVIAQQPGSQANAPAAQKDNTGTGGGDKHQTAGGSNTTPSSVKGAHILAMDKHRPKGKSFFPLSAPATRRDTTGSIAQAPLTSMDNNAGTLLVSRGDALNLSAVNVQDLPQPQFMLNSADGLPLYTADEPLLAPIRDIMISNKRRPQYAITVLAASNINGVNSFNEAKVGADIGLQFSVSISKFTFTTGAVYAKTPYLTPFDSYHTSYPFKVNPVNVSADCRVLDIPLNIAYQVYSKSGNKFSVGSGLSSYIMLSESYQYNYANTGIYGPTNSGPSGINIVNQNQHFLGVLNLNTTYQRKLSSKLSLDIQPYLKIPLTDIGYSRVKLQTAGVAFGLSWNFNSLTKP